MTLTIRQALPSDAAQILAYMDLLTAEPGVNIALWPGEFNYTVDEEAAVISSFAAQDNSLFLVAEADGQIAGVLTLQGGTRKAFRHTASLGMSVAAPWRGQGVGSQLVEAALEWARATRILTRIELCVLTRNQPAIKLYQKYGFEIEGCLRQALYREGQYHDDYWMGLLL
jgi:RimJ/RimL family protein N-acetyltransferase